MDEKKDPLSAMPNSMKPQFAQNQNNMPALVKAENKTSKTKILLWIIVIIIGIVAAVQYINAAKYSSLVQVIKEDRIGVNPTGNALDFGDLPRNKSAIRTVNLSSSGSTPSYIMVWMFGSISDFVKVDQNYFTLKPHSAVKLQFTASIPNSAAYQYYKGNVIIFQIPKIW